MTAEPMQLSLGVTLNDDATFENFYAADEGASLLLESLASTARDAGKTDLEGQSMVIWGTQGCGLTHLLQGACHLACAEKRSVQYLPLRDIRGYAAEDICDGLGATQLVCLDGLDLICGNPAWEHALFHLYNQLRDAGHSLVMASHVSPPLLPIALPDLKSRILGSVVFHVHSLEDDDKQAALIMRAAARGLQMSAEVAKFILQRSSREMNNLFFLLNRLDECSMQQQRKLTIPFVKEVLRLK
ncbi:MAG: DnaA regulatory inactivator Hda [Agarilytica sp.]